MTIWMTFTVYMVLCWGFKPQTAKWVPLFNGQDLYGWEKYLGVPNAESHVPILTTDIDGNYITDLGIGNDPLEVFSVVTQDGQPAIRVSGEVFGTLIFKGANQNYHLKLEYKWGEKKWPPRKDLPRDSGLLYHGFGEPGCVRMRWHHSQELQIQEGDCGDYWTVGDVEIDIPSTKKRTAKDGFNTILMQV